MTNESADYELPTPAEFFKEAVDCDLITEVSEALREEEASKPDFSAIREQEDWSAVANRVVGAEHTGTRPPDMLQP